MKKEIVVRAPAVAGTFYPGPAAELRAAVQAYLDKAGALSPSGTVVAAMAPHAGYAYSAPVAAFVYKALPLKEVDTIVIIGHDCHVPGAVAFVSTADAFETPLGRVPVDRAMVDALLKANPGIRAENRIHAREHTVEVHLPFLQVLDYAGAIVPVLFGQPSVENARIFADAIRSAAGSRRVLVLASTDLSHYPPQAEARRLDLRTLEALTSMDTGKFFAYLDKADADARVPGLQTAMCSRGGVGTAIFFARERGADSAQILRYANSGDVAFGDPGRCVGYGAALLTRSAAAKAP